METIFSKVLERLPDVHRWVEPRALLLRATCDVFGYQEAPELSVIVRDEDGETLFVIGNPGVPVVKSVLRQSPNVREVVATQQYATKLVGLLPGWSRTTIFVHRLRDSARLVVNVGVVETMIRPLVTRIEGMDLDLSREFERNANDHWIATAFTPQRVPIAGCYAGAITETLWDVAVDTAKAYRRQGYARSCVAHMVMKMRKEAQPKEPVWQAAEDNPASCRLAKKLGFERVDELAWFRKDD